MTQSAASPFGMQCPWPMGSSGLSCWSRHRSGPAKATVVRMPFVDPKKEIPRA
jgi:hypothetical protein